MRHAPPLATASPDTSHSSTHSTTRTHTTPPQKWGEVKLRSFHTLVRTQGERNTLKQLKTSASLLSLPSKPYHSSTHWVQTAGVRRHRLSWPPPHRAIGASPVGGKPKGIGGPAVGQRPPLPRHWAGMDCLPGPGRNTSWSRPQRPFCRALARRLTQPRQRPETRESATNPNPAWWQRKCQRCQGQQTCRVRLALLDPGPCLCSGLAGRSPAAALLG